MVSKVFNEPNLATSAQAKWVPRTVTKEFTKNQFEATCKRCKTPKMISHKFARKIPGGITNYLCAMCRADDHYEVQQTLIRMANRLKAHK